mmetsp:Transcript_5393/g.8279  ORF Transcript_5393/g.8279 Transcript_5393/m.8279 type:complete len:147 (-) Transcript_5393:1155-1595(-)
MKEEAEEDPALKPLPKSKKVLEDDSDMCKEDVEWDDIERTRREKLATKHDEAAIPEYLWCEHLVTDFEWKLKDGLRPIWISEDRDALPQAMRVLERMAFLFWKRKLRREFEKYLGREVKKLHKKFALRLKRVAVEAPTSRPRVDET